MEVFGLIKLPNIGVFKLYIESLWENLGLYPQDEAKILCALFKSGQVHSKFAFHVIEDAYEEMTNAGGKLAFDKPEMIGLVVLAIAVSLSAEPPIHHMLRSIISAACVFFGRISYALRELMNQNTLLAYISLGGSSRMEIDDQLSETPSKFREDKLPFTKSQKDMLIGVTESVKLILAATKSSWELAKSSCTSEALKVLRLCQEELDTIEADTAPFSGIRDFGLHYVRVVKRLTKLWDHIMFPVKHFHGMGCLDLLLNELEKHILHLTYRFKGFSKEDELHILEFVLLNHVLRLYRFQRCCKTVEKLQSTISHVQHLRERVSVTPSEFVNEFEKLPMSSGLIEEPLLLKNMVSLFELKDIMLSQSIKHIKAELEFPGFDSEIPFPFISGLPVGVPCEITLYNVSSEHRLWLHMKVNGESSQFHFLDLDQFGEYDEVMKFVQNAPLYRTPNAAAFALTVRIGMECSSEDPQLQKGHIGPRCPLIYLCEEKEIEFLRVDRN